MSKSRAFWNYVYSVGEDIRSDVRRDVIEQGWFKRPITPAYSVSDASQDDPEIPQAPCVAPQIDQSNALYEEVWGEEPAADDLYGNGPSYSDIDISGPEPEPETSEPQIECEPEP